MEVLYAPTERKAQSKRQRVRPTYTLRSYYYCQKPGLWIGECIDLDIAVQAKTSDEARKELTDAILGYLKVVFSSENIEGLVPRPSPWSHRFLYRFLCLRAALTSNRESFRISDCSSNQLICA